MENIVCLKAYKLRGREAGGYRIKNIYIYIFGTEICTFIHEHETQTGEDKCKHKLTIMHMNQVEIKCQNFVVWKKIERQIDRVELKKMERDIYINKKQKGKVTRKQQRTGLT